MNEAAKAWVDALRSGRFRQARHALRVLEYDSRLPSLCCLGVACEISGLGEWQKENLFCESSSGGDSTDDFLSRAVAKRIIPSRWMSPCSSIYPRGSSNW